MKSDRQAAWADRSAKKFIVLGPIAVIGISIGHARRQLRGIPELPGGIPVGISRLSRLVLAVVCIESAVRWYPRGNLEPWMPLFRQDQ